MSEIADLDGPHWKFALEIYSGEGVSEACLALQDRFELDVIVLLIGLYGTVGQGKLAQSEDIARMDAAICDWRRTVVHPLRAIRRHIKQSSYGEPVSRFRDVIKSTELRSEQIELAILAAQIKDLPACAPGPVTSEHLSELIVRTARVYTPTAEPAEIGRIADPITKAAAALASASTGQPSASSKSVKERARQ